MRLLRAVSLPLLIFAAAFAVSLARAPGATPIPTRAPGGGVPFVEPTTDPAAARMLSDAVQAPRRLSYVGRISTIAWGADGTRALEMAVDHRAPDLTRTWYIAPSPVYGNYVIERGSTSYAFDMHAETVTISHYPTADEDDIADASNFGLLTTNYRAVPGADDEVAGRHAHTLSLVNRYTGARLQRIWIDARTSLMLAKERYYANGSVAFSSRYQQLAYRSVPDALFQPAVPLGFKTVQGRSFGAPSSNVEHVLREAGFSASGPRYLPEGFALVSGDVTTIKGVRSLHLLYSDGLRSLSLFENANPQGGANFAGLQARDATVQGHGAKYVEDEPNVLLAWRERNLNLTLVGDLPLRELERIAASVVP
ncbi:MAG: MucB/RseB C-terminal domain-containing protein [bacterium]|nr:MucB/RseB C-terminal domain-containing protein [bacterium]